MTGFRLVGMLAGLPVGTWVYDTSGAAMGIIEEYRSTQRRGSFEATETVRGLNDNKSPHTNAAELMRRANNYRRLNQMMVYVKLSSQPVATETKEILDSKGTVSASASKVPAAGRWE